MIDFTQQNYMYQCYENNLILKGLLRDCKTDEEREEAIKKYQGISLLSFLVAFVIAIVFCGILSTFI